MTDGTSQGLFIVVAVVIFGIFILLSYILFEDTLSPAMASMFSEATEQASNNLTKNYQLVGAWNHELRPDTDDWGVKGTFSEFLQYVDLAPIFDEHGVGRYKITYELKTFDKTGQARIYFQNGTKTRYAFASGTKNTLKPTLEYKQYTIEANIIKSTESEERAMLAFFTEANSKVYPSVKNVKIYKVIEK